jgi:hypothetical protein
VLPILTRLLNYRAVERPRPKHLAPLLAGLTAGSVLAGILVAFTPAPTPPAGDTDASLALAALSRNISAPLVESAQRAALMPMAAPAIQAAPRVAAVGSGGGVLGMVNSERAAAGCPPLRFDPQLASMAQSHASDMASRDYFAHSSGADGENIAYGQTSSAEVMQEWMNSPGHRANILNCEYTRFGAGYDSAGNYWVQEFGY